MNRFLESCDEVDAGVFSGDALSDPETRKAFSHLLQRWTRGLNTWDESDEQEDEE